MRQIFLNQKKSNNKRIFEIYSTSVHDRIKQMLLKQFENPKYEVEYLQIQLIEIYNQMQANDQYQPDIDQLNKYLIQIINIISYTSSNRQYLTQDFFETNLIPIVQKLFVKCISYTQTIQILTIILFIIIEIGWQYNQLETFPALFKSMKAEKSVQPYIYLLIGKYISIIDNEITFQDLLTGTQYLIKQDMYIKQLYKNGMGMQNNNYVNQASINFEFECYLQSNVDFIKCDFLDFQQLYNFVNGYLNSGIKHPTFQYYLYFMLIEVITYYNHSNYEEVIHSVIAKVQHLTQYIYNEYLNGRYYFTLYENEFFFLLKLIEGITNYYDKQKIESHIFEDVEQYINTVTQQSQKMLSIVPDNSYAQSSIITFLLYQNRFKTVKNDYIMTYLRQYQNKKKVTYKIMQFLYDYEYDKIEHLTIDDIDFLAQMQSQSTSNMENRIITDILQAWAASDDKKLEYLIEHNYVVDPSSDLLPLPPQQIIKL